MPPSRTFDVAIIGGGIAGLSVALRLPDTMKVALFTKGQLGESNTRYAQGGLAVAVGEDDSPELHFQDTIQAGAGLCDEQAVRILVEQGPAAVKWLMQVGVKFDRAELTGDTHATRDGLLLGREAAHSRWRVLHAGGDATGAEIERALMVALYKRSSIALYEETFVNRLLVDEGTCIGLEAVDRDGHIFSIASRATILASGGAGGLWLHTSNPAGATADGLALAWQAGAALSDLEFMQFHPTVLVTNGTSHLISEAVRGEGAYLRNHAGERFMPEYHPLAELAPRDVVARAILSEMLAEQVDCQYLDLRHLPAEKMYTRFPTISEICRTYGLDLAKDLLPVAPAAHYCMGGVMVDMNSRTTLPDLYAVGEVACTGVHGANRLASNSLLEGLVFGLRLADSLASTSYSHKSVQHHDKRSSTFQLIPVEERQTHLGELNTASLDRDIGEVRKEVRRIMWQYVSLCRDEQGLVEAKHTIDTLRQKLLGSQLMPRRDRFIESDGRFIAPSDQPRVLPQFAETLNMLQAAELVILAALQRHESRGSHWRSDYEATDPILSAHHYAFYRVPVSPEVTQHFQEVHTHA